MNFEQIFTTPAMPYITSSYITWNFSSRRSEQSTCLLGSSCIDCLRIDTFTMISQIFTMLCDHPTLLSSLNCFLPPGFYFLKNGFQFPYEITPEMPVIEWTDNILEGFPPVPNAPETFAARRALHQSVFLLKQFFINITISEDRTGSNGSELRIRLCALRESEVLTGQYLRTTSRLYSKN